MPIDYSLDEGVAIITLNRPDVLNAFDDELGREALAAVERASGDDEVRCIVITGAGKAFSAGEDLNALSGQYESGTAPKLGSILQDRYNPLIRAIRNAPKPVVAAVNGVAAGAGASVALACDFRIASEHAKLTLAFIKVGLVPDSGALWFLTKMIGMDKTWELAVSGEAVDADEGYNLGLFTRVADQDEFEETWRGLARNLARGPTLAYGLTKALVSVAAESTLEEQLRYEVNAQSEAGSSEDHLEGVRAFLEKRRPDFKGR